MKFALTGEQQLLRKAVREFAEAEIRPHVREWDAAQHFPRELVPKLADLGLMGIQFPEQYGGAGMSPGRKEDKLGMRASDTSEVIFDSCRLDADHLLGQEGEGFVNAMKVLDAGRIGIAALAVGLAQGVKLTTIGEGTSEIQRLVIARQVLAE
jgi:alkylation response protein AidB-like acyl-CoA dehydrogenase